MAIDNSSNEKKRVGESDAGLRIEIPQAYVSEYLGRWQFLSFMVERSVVGNDDSSETWWTI